MRVLLTLVCSLFFLSCSNNKADKTNEAANEIIIALNKYKNEKGDYPLKLSDLVPDYLDFVPITFYGKRNNVFKYQRFEVDSTEVRYYELWFYTQFGVEARYNSINKSWDYDD